MHEDFHRKNWENSLKSTESPDCQLSFGVMSSHLSCHKFDEICVMMLPPAAHKMDEKSSWLLAGFLQGLLEKLYNVELRLGGLVHQGISNRTVLV